MFKKAVYVFGFIALLAFAISAYFFRYDIHDWWVLRSYQPSEEIETIARTVDFTSHGERLFYVHDPQLLDAETFNERCPEKEASVVLGCYNGRNIFIFNVNNDKLAGVEEITAAHEMLHAAYERLSPSEVESLTSWLRVAEESITNPRIQKVIENYSDLDESQRINELHSILGTEVRNLPEYLENHYRQYFADRSTIVAISEEYEAVFEAIQRQIQQFDEQLATLSLQIRAAESQLEAQANELSAMNDELEQLLADNQINRYNQLVPVYNAKIANYNQEVSELKQQIEQYNQIVYERNLLGAEQNDLVISIDSRFQELERE